MVRMTRWKRLTACVDILLDRPKWTKRRPRERFLLPHEWAILRPILLQQPDKMRVYFSMLLLEGPRMSEARLMQRAHVDLVQGIWHKPTTKNGRRQILALSAQSCDLLSGLVNEGPYFFRGETPEVPWSRTAVEVRWRKIRKAACLDDVQIRDLRRTTATWLSMHQENLVTIRDVLHHSSLSTTQIYARADQASTRAALTRHAERMFPKGPCSTP
jgi:integrase